MYLRLYTRPPSAQIMACRLVSPNIWTYGGLLIEALRTNIDEIWIKIWKFEFEFKNFAKLRAYWLGLDGLTFISENVYLAGSRSSFWNKSLIKLMNTEQTQYKYCIAQKNNC